MIYQTECPIIKFTISIDQYLRPLISLRDCSVLEIFVLISLFKRAMFDCSSKFTFQDMKRSIEYPRFKASTHQILMVQKS